MFGVLFGLYVVFGVLFGALGAPKFCLLDPLPVEAAGPPSTKRTKLLPVAGPGAPKHKEN